MTALKASDAYLSLGSNMGDRRAHLVSAMHMLAQNPMIEVLKVSSVYETEPWGMADQRFFYNIVALIQTKLSPINLLQFCQQIEQKQHRERDIPWGPRTLDIDILCYGDLTLNSPELTIPHPRMEERDFVQVPLAEVMHGEFFERPGIRRICSNWYPTDGNYEPVL